MSELSINGKVSGAPLLSICIPTFNRERFLKECLDSLENTWISDIEIVISDNASTDETIALVEDYERRLPLRWQRHPTNLGSDRNFAAVVSMARGRYCWLLGSDDCVTPGALGKVIDQLRLHDPDILHFGYVQADITMHPLSKAAPTASGTPISMTTVELSKYLSTLPNVSLLFAFISSFIFRRERWTEQSARLPAWLDSHYVHAFMVHAMLASGATVLSTDECFVTARGGNPNEFNSSAGRMLALDAVTLVRINREIYQDESHLQALGLVFRKSYRVRTIIRIASQGGVPQLILCYPALKQLGLSRSLIRALRVAHRLGLMPLLWRLQLLRLRVVNASPSPQTSSKK
jgi:abequosyltransferase